MQRKCSDSVTGAGGKKVPDHAGREALWRMWPLDWALEIRNIRRIRAQKTGFLAQDQLETGLPLSVWGGGGACVYLFPYLQPLFQEEDSGSPCLRTEGSSEPGGWAQGSVLGIHGVSGEADSPGEL